MGDNLLQGGTLCFEVKCPGRTVYFEVKCPGGGLLRSNLPPGHFTSGGRLLRDTSLAAETTGGEKLVAFWPKHDLRSNLRVPNFKNFPGGACPQTPLASYLTLTYALLVPQHIGCTNLKYLAPALSIYTQMQSMKTFSLSSPL